ncbi:MAG: GNAT family N-acetyltransferase [Actinomycetota bacterium]
MTLPEEVRNFWYAFSELGQRMDRTGWGLVQTDPRFPLVWDANNACVLEADPALTLESIRRELLPSLRAAGAPYEHVEFWDTSVESPALREARDVGQRFDPDVVMALEDPASVPATGTVRTKEIVRPDPSFWPWYRDSLKEFGDDLSESVLDQMLRRVREVFQPAGIRWFVGFVDEAMAGYASVISLHGVAYLDNVVTMPGFRRRGVAAATVEAVMRATLESGHTYVFLLAEENSAPQRLYERLGFRARTRIESFTRRLGDG